MYNDIRVGNHYTFDLTVPNPKGRDHKELVSGWVLEKVQVRETKFLVLDQQRAINMDYVTRALGEFGEF